MSIRKLNEEETEPCVRAVSHGHISAFGGSHVWWGRMISSMSLSFINFLFLLCQSCPRQPRFHFPLSSLPSFLLLSSASHCSASLIVLVRAHGWMQIGGFPKRKKKKIWCDRACHMAAELVGACAVTCCKTALALGVKPNMHVFVCWVRPKRRAGWQGGCEGKEGKKGKLCSEWSEQELCNKTEKNPYN